MQLIRHLLGEVDHLLQDLTESASIWARLSVLAFCCSANGSCRPLPLPSPSCCAENDEPLVELGVRCLWWFVLATALRRGSRSASG